MSGGSCISGPGWDYTSRVRRKARRKLRRARDAVSYDTLTGLLAKTLGHVVYRRIVLVGRSLEQPPPEAETDLGSVSVRSLTRDDVASYARFQPDSDPKTVLKRLENGSLVYAAWNDGRIVSAAWVDRGTAHLDPIGVSLQLDPRDVYGRGSYTLPELRGHNVATVRMVGALRALREDGYEAFFGYVLPENRRAFRTAVKASLDRLGSIGWIGLGPFRLYFVVLSDRRSRIHPRFKRLRRPVSFELGRPYPR